MISTDLLRRLAQFDTPTICNAIELFDVRPRNTGFMDGRIRAAFPDFPPAVGFACTASFRSDSPPSAGDAYGGFVEQVKLFEGLAGPPMMVFQDLDDPAVGATFGEVMCSVYKAFGAAGLITSGGGRDLLQVRAMGFPVFTGSAISAHAYCHLLHLGQPVRVGGLTIRQGDLLHADANGVTSIPLEIAQEVPEAAAALCDAERILIGYCRQDRPTLAGLGQARQEFTDAMARLSRRYRRG